jgi:uncharacterized membrane protein YdjX (TVP38/TMEM64 family)
LNDPQSSRSSSVQSVRAHALVARDGAPRVAVRRVKLSASWIAGVFVVAATIAALFFLEHPGPLESLLDGVERLGPWGPLALVGIDVVATVLFVPGLLLNIAAGALFGVFVGSVCSLTGSTLGAIAAFLVGRRLRRKRDAQSLDERTRALDAAVGQEGFKVVLLSRLAPGVPFNVLNYALGLTRVSFRDFTLGSVVAMLPFRVAYAYIGSVAGTFASLHGEVEAMSGSRWTLLIAGLAVTVLCSLWIARIAKRAMQPYLESCQAADALDGARVRDEIRTPPAQAG